jgi:Na+-driven multidrug efflux pump
MINIAVVGHLGDPAMIAGIGLGNMTVNLIGLSMKCGFNSALDTLISHAAGRSELRLCGLYLNRGRCVMTCVFIPAALVLLNTKSILLRLRQDAQAARFA